MSERVGFLLGSAGFLLENVGFLLESAGFLLEGGTPAGTWHMFTS